MINNKKINQYSFLEEMHSDDYFPNFIVDKGKKILTDLCQSIETEEPQSLEALYALTHSATDKFNSLDEEFGENGSEIETAARECIATDFEYIASAYGFKDADIEELIATRDW